MTEASYPEFTAMFSAGSEPPFFGYALPGEHNAGSGFLVFIPLNSDLADYPPEADGLEIEYLKLETPVQLTVA